jgi:hypothetical protein
MLFPPSRCPGRPAPLPLALCPPAPMCGPHCCGAPRAFHRNGGQASELPPWQRRSPALVPPHYSHTQCYEALDGQPVRRTLSNALFHGRAPEVKQAETVTAHALQATASYKTGCAGRLRWYPPGAIVIQTCDGILARMQDRIAV